MAITAIELVGFKEFLNAARAMPDQLKAKQMKEIMKNNLKPMTVAIRNQTPVRKGLKLKTRRRKDGEIAQEYLPGNLKRSIGVRTFGKDDITAYVGIQKGRHDGWYGFFLARGTKHIQKNDFITRAATPLYPIVINNLETDIKNHIVRHAKRLGLDAK